MNIKLVKLTAEYKKQLTDMMDEWLAVEKLSLIHISEPTRLISVSRMPSSA